MNPVRAKLVEKPEDWPWSSRSPMVLPNLDDDFDPWPAPKSYPTLIRPRLEESTLEQISLKIASMAGIGLGAMRSGSKSPKIVEARIRVTVEGVQNGHTLSSIAAYLNLPVSSASYYLSRIRRIDKPDTIEQRIWEPRDP